MYRGSIVEMGPASAVFAAPRHAYTQTLLSAVPALDPGATRERLTIDPAALGRGPLQEVAPGHFAAV